MPVGDTGVLLVDWDNLAGAIIGRGYLVERGLVNAIAADATQRCGGHLQHKHMAAVKFDATIVAAMADNGIIDDRVRSAKEQADIHLTVLAMDYLHRENCGQFVLVTGDQDFIPLIQRLQRDRCRVTVIYGDIDRLSSEFRRIIQQQGLDSLSIDQIYDLRKPPPPTARALLGLLELQRNGVILGGRKHSTRVATLASWGVLASEGESNYWALIEQLCARVVRNDAAIKIGERFAPRTSTRTYLDITQARLADIVAIDYTVRRLTSRPNGLTITQLRTGPFQADDGTAMLNVLDALTGVQLVRKGADNAYAVTTNDLALGYLEPLWRVYAAVTVECFKNVTRTIEFSKVQGLISSSGIGQGRSRAAGLASRAIDYALSAGVIDAVAVNGARHALPLRSPLVRPLETAYYLLYRAFVDRTPAAIRENEVLDFMAEHDRTHTNPVFGYDRRDQHRIIRVLSQSRAITWRNGMITIPRSPWGDAGTTVG